MEDVSPETALKRRSEDLRIHKVRNSETGPAFSVQVREKSGNFVVGQGIKDFSKSKVILRKWTNPTQLRCLETQNILQYGFYTIRIFGRILIYLL